MNPFEVMENVQKGYRQYTESFQNFPDNQIRGWIDQQIENGEYCGRIHTWNWSGDFARDVALTI